MFEMTKVNIDKSTNFRKAGMLTPNNVTPTTPNTIT